MKLNPALSAVLNAALALACLPSLAQAEDHADSSFDYFYVEANEGGSAGGHAAIRFDEHTYHFQYASSGLLEMARTPTVDFLAEYALLSNRSIHVTRVAATSETREALHRAFDRRYWSEQRQLRTLSLLHESSQWLDERELRLPVTGAGYFDPARESPVSRRLGDAIQARYGRDALPRRRDAARADALRAARASGPVQAPSLAESLRDSLAALTAIETLRSGSGLDPRWLIEDDHASSLLNSSELAALSRTRSALEDRLVDLFASQRPDWGTPFLVGLARLLALEATIERGRLVLLDAFPDDPLRVRPSGDRWNHIGPELLARSQERFDLAKQRVVSAGTYREMDLSRLESAGNRLAELRAGVEHRSPVRMAHGTLVPSRAAPSVVLDGIEPRSLSRALRHEHDRLRDHLERDSGYNVIGRNCVSAIFETIDGTLAELAGSETPEAIRAESLRRLGGRVDPAMSLSFIPFVSSRHVRERYRTIDSFLVVSDREARLQEMRGRESDLWVYLRESNVLTSTIYERGHDDSLFLFFTEDAVATRPIYGAANLAVGLGASVAGLFWAPLDRGEVLVGGLRGALSSLPELFFVNIRKGSNDYVMAGSEREALAGDLAFPQTQ